MSDIQSAENQPVASVAGNSAAEPRGIGGWLLVVALGQVVGVLQLLVQLGQHNLDPENRRLFAQYPLAISGELVMSVGLLLFALTTAALFFRKSPRFPRFFIGELVAIPAFIILDTVWVALAFSIQLGVPLREFLVMEQQDIVQFSLSVVAALIWIPYTLKSSRVRNTFAAPGARADAANVRDQTQRQLLLRAIVFATFALGLCGIVAGLGQLIGRGVLSGQLVGGALQIALAIWLFRGSDVARIILAFLFSVALVAWIGFALWRPDQGLAFTAVMLALAIISGGCAWTLIFSRRFRNELAINAAIYRKAAPEGA